MRDNLARIRDNIDRVRTAHGLEQEVRVIAVTKGHPVDAVHAAVDAGLEDVGENRVQEAVAKQDAAGSLPIRWHLIGHLQTNKVKFVPGRFGRVHSVDSLKIAEALDRTVARHSGGTGSPLPVLLQVNVAGEEQKSGCPVDDAGETAHAIHAMQGLALDGLMTMAPFTSDEQVQRRVFGTLRQLRDTLEGDGLSLPELSMGMSADYLAAVAEGATMVRLGTVLFGERGR